LEHLLNLVWVLAVAAVVLATRGQAHPVSRGRLLGLGAFLCISMLLFPVISASDDLHPGFDLSDDAAWRHEKRGPGVVALIALMLACVLALPRPESSFLRITVEHPASFDPGFLRLDLSRAPPRVL
jgi:hypothetical protein